MTTEALRIQHLTKTFRCTDRSIVNAVDGIDLTVGAGEVVAVLGPNGAGKTTTLDMVLGLTRPDSGSVEVYGLTPREAARSGRVAAVLQNGGLLDDFTVGETMSIVASLHGRSAEVPVAMERAGITDLAGRRVSRCSGGEQQRLKFALATLPDPDLIVLDEPTAGMDVESRRSFWSTMRADAGAGRTVVFATHYLEEAEDFADRIVMLAGGRIVADGSAAEIRTLASRRVVSAVLDEADLAAVGRTIADLEVIDRRGGRIFMTCSDSDDLGRALFTSTSARDVEIATHNLEDAFIALTSDAA